MNKKEWNPEDWQGRSQQQVESNYTILNVVYSIIAITFLSWATLQVIKNLTF